MICPFMEDADSRCADHFSLNNLSDAFGFCFGRYQACPVYQRMLRDRASGRTIKAAAPVAALAPAGAL
jgi:hypothetical protein